MIFNTKKIQKYVDYVEKKLYFCNFVLICE